eukprot:TRINITY_DN1430_c0_g1_i1.p1 TRINITY_DN1430_c0_g1~~TRINITY_DN1430_c0_g1_i1.p1  ORF type:complete len:363 (-),score=79.96 TRINITY_DN1430_c0_g1_i1:137-1225(-)
MCFKSKSSDPANERIEKELKVKAKTVQRKMLLLGTGNSGKSTFSKQLTAAYGGSNPHLQASNAEVVNSLRQNVLEGMKKLVIECEKRAASAALDWPSASLKAGVQAITQWQITDALTPELADSIVEIFADPHVAKTLAAVGDHLTIPGGTDGITYFVNNVKSYAKPDYQYTNEDLMRNRVKTTGILESTFLCNGIEFTICDVAGQRTERRKWIHCFSNVSAIIYVTSVNEYDTAMEEATNQNSLADSLQQFRIITELQCFKEVPFIVFLNKIDLLPQKLKSSPLCKVFKDYDIFISQTPDAANMDDTERAVAYFESIYNKHFRAEFCEYHTTCALDKDNCAKVFESIQRSLVARAFSSTSLL